MPVQPSDVPSSLRLNANEPLLRVDRPAPAAPEVWSRYILTLGLYEFWRRVTLFAITEQRLAFRKGLVAIKTEKSLPLHFVQDAAVSQVFWWAWVTVSTAGGSQGLGRLGPMGTGQAREFKDDLLAAAQRARRGHQSDLG